MKYFIIDLETNGLKTDFHEITEISILRCEDMVQKVWLLNIHNPKNTNKEAFYITGQDLNKILRRRIYLEDIIEEVDSFINEDGEEPDGRVGIAHNCSFDRRQLESNWSRLNRVFPINYWLDSKEIARKYIKMNKMGKQSIALSKLLDLFNIKSESNHHSAEVDVRNTFRLWKYLEKRGMKNIEFTKLSPTLIENDMKKIRKESYELNNDDVNSILDELNEEEDNSPPWE